MIKNIVAIGGIPGTGKTTIMRKLIDRADDWVAVKPIQLLDSIYSKSLRTYVLGKYQPWYDGEGYAQGTDRLSMAVQPAAMKWFKEIEADPDNTDSVLFEGDRLFTQTFLEFCSGLDCNGFDIAMLTTNQNILDARYAQRGSDQSEKFIKGRRTKYSNLGGNFDLLPSITDYPNNDMEDQQVIIEDIVELLEAV